MKLKVPDLALFSLAVSELLAHEKESGATREEADGG